MKYDRLEDFDFKLYWVNPCRDVCAAMTQNTKLHTIQGSVLVCANSLSQARAGAYRRYTEEECIDLQYIAFSPKEADNGSN